MATRTDPVSWPGLPRLLADLERVKSRAEDTAGVDADGARVMASGVRAHAPVRSGYLAGSVGSEGNGVTIRADYWTFVDAGTSRMAAHPFVGVGVSGTVGQLEDLYADHLQDAFSPVIGSHY